jgi:nucleoside-diphosphate-sugar epimerase
MRVFVTGATGFIGSAVVEELLGAGHQVLGLSRSDAGATSLVAAGAAVHRGSLEDLDSLKRGAAAADGVVHAAFIHDFSDFAASVTADKLAIEAIGATLAGSDKPFLVSSGCLGLHTEEDEPAHAFPRKSEETALAGLEQGVRAMVMRFPPSVHGDGDHGFVPMLIKAARDNGFAFYVGEGTNLWPAVHRLDAAKLVRLALEKGTAGTKLHVVADEGIPFRQIAEGIAARLGVPAVSKTPEEAAKLLGFIGTVAGMGGLTSSARTRTRFAWQPTQPGLLADLEKGTYFSS